MWLFPLGAVALGGLWFYPAFDVSQPMALVGKALEKDSLYKVETFDKHDPKCMAEDISMNPPLV